MIHRNGQLVAQTKDRLTLPAGAGVLMEWSGCLVKGAAAA